jgi:hypothetical protein
MVIAGGIIGAVAGEREFEKHGSEATTESGGESTESGLAPIVAPSP